MFLYFCYVLTVKFIAMSTPKDLLTFGEFLSRHDDYNNNYLNHKPYKLESFWIDYDKLHEYLSYVEDEARRKQIDISGYRFHLIVEDGHVNIALAPTVDDNGKQVCFDPHKSSAGNPAYYKSLLNDRSLANEKSDILNKFRLCPPNCDK